MSLEGRRPKGEGEGSESGDTEVRPVRLSKCDGPLLLLLPEMQRTHHLGEAVWGKREKVSDLVPKGATERTRTHAWPPVAWRSSPVKPNDSARHRSRSAKDTENTRQRETNR